MTCDSPCLDCVFQINPFFGTTGTGICGLLMFNFLSLDLFFDEISGMTLFVGFVGFFLFFYFVFVLRNKFCRSGVSTAPKWPK